MMHAQLRNVLERLKAIRTTVNKKLDEVEEDIKQQTSSLSERKSKEYDHNRVECEGTVNVLKRDLDMLYDVKNHGSPEQQFIAQQKVNESLESTSVKASGGCAKLEKTDISLQLNPNLEALLDSTEKLASLKTKTSKVTLDSIVEGTPVKLKKIASADILQNEDEKEPFYTRIDFLQDGRLVAVDNKNDKCIILNDQLERYGSCKLSNKPLSLVSMSEDEVAVTSVQNILFLRVSKHNEIAEIRSVKTTSKCFSICLKDSGHFIAGLYDDTKPVRVISFLGEEKHLNIDFPDKKFGIDDSTCTYIKNSDKAVFTDMNEHNIYIYYIKDNINVVVKDDRIKQPSGVAIGPFDSIFVCCNERNTIVQVSQTGKILSSHKLEMKLPYTVCISKDKTKLAV